MYPQPAASPARVLAPAALVICAIAFFVIILSSGGGGGSGSSERAGGKTAPKTQRAAGRQRRSTRVTGNSYRVKAGDTLGGIAEKTGVPVDQLQQLNPQLDPQALVAGQKIKLRD
jgi:LysM domain-containing protein